MIDTSVFKKRRITCPEELTHRWVAAFIRRIGIDTSDKTIQEVQAARTKVYAEYLKAAPRGRPADKHQYDLHYNDYHNVDAMKKCLDMLVELHCWLMEE